MLSIRSTTPTPTAAAVAVTTVVMTVVAAAAAATTTTTTTTTTTCYQKPAVWNLNQQPGVPIAKERDQTLSLSMLW